MAQITDVVTLTTGEGYGQLSFGRPRGAGHRGGDYVKTFTRLARQAAF